MRKKKSALLYSIISLVLCLSMLVSTTFAWFTDSVKTGINTIASGVLDVELYHSNAAVTDEQVTAETKLFMDLQGNPILWEPGVVSYENLRITNAGDLALCYEATVNTANENYVQDPSGALYGLSHILKVGFVEGGITATDRDAVVASVEEGSWTSLSNFLQRGSLLPESAGEFEETWGIVIYWQPGEFDNYWNLNNGKQLNEGEVLSIDLGIKLVATQEIYEEDSFGNNYDVMAGFTKGKIDVTVSTPVAVSDEGKTEQPVTLGNASAGVSAEIPAGVDLAEGTSTLTLTVKTMDESGANVKLAKGETSTSLDVHVDGLAEDNTTPVLVKLERLFAPNLNSGNYAMYHVEDGVTVQMTCVATLAELDAHNEFYYDVATGDVVMSVVSFSEYVAVTDNKNLWEGNFDTSWYNTTATEFTLTTADQLAGFGAIVDGTAEGIAADTFANKTVYLGADINLAGGVSLNPIGCGYDPDTGVSNSGGVEGRPFKGTFDGQGFTISNLYQNGWDIGLSYCNLGGGLFASIANGTVKDLNIDGANIVMECVEQGVLVGLSQGSCTYENINIYNSKVANYQKATGGLIGEVTGAGTTNINNVIIGSDVVVGSLWGDFDAPVGGVIGARWANGADPKINMNNVTVSCRLDVYNDVTSTYQWYAYRRAGMLIGNTETSKANANGTNVATADFLKCTNVTVEYGGWVDYHYCEFSEEYNSPSWPFVRVEKGENCNAFSNPRWGVAKDANGNAITSISHTHTGDDDHNVELTFNQLYGGGQGVYGQPTHDGVTVVTYKYKVEFINKGELLYTYYATNNDSVYTLPGKESDVAKLAVESMEQTDIEFSHWINAGSTAVPSIPAGNIENYKVYPSFVDLYTATFVDQQGNILGYEFFAKGNDGAAVKTKAQSITPPEVEDCTFNQTDYANSWEVHYTNDDGTVTPTKLGIYDFTKADRDITIYPIYTYDGDVNLIPVDTDGDGATDYYQVGGYTNPSGQDLVRIPAEVNGIKVTEINENAFSSYADLHSVVIPENVTMINNFAFAKEWGRNNWDGETITLYYEGSYEDWMKVEGDFAGDWDNGLGAGSRIFFLNGGDTVDVSEGYLEYSIKKNLIGMATSGSWSSSPKAVTTGILEEYYATCACNSCNGNDRPDKAYWEGVTVN